MMGKIGLLGTLVFLGVLLVLFSMVPEYAESAQQETGTTMMNVTIRGAVSITASDCITNGITFQEQDPGDNGENASCNWGVGDNGGSGYNLTVDTSSTVNVNFTHASNRSNLTTGTYTLDIGNVTTRSNSTSDDGTNLLDNESATSLSTGWLMMEECEGVTKGGDCWITYFLNVPAAQDAGDYQTGYCWCGRQENEDPSLCGTCT